MAVAAAWPDVPPAWRRPEAKPPAGTRRIPAEAAIDAGAAASRLSRRQLLAVVIGNGLEHYDFVIYAIFAVQIGRTFFPSERPGFSVLAALATFGVGFVTRPLGAVLIGRMGDHVGRKPAMLLSFTLIGLAIVGLALTPGYAAIGPAAPVLAVAFRLLQGFALGGEVGPSTAFLLECAPPMKRGFYVSLQAMSSDASVLVAGATGVALSALLDPVALEAWGWRLALLLGSAVVPFAFAVRRTLAETLHAGEAAADVAVQSRPRWTVVLICLTMLAGATISNYVLVYLNTFATTTLGIVATSGFGSVMLVGLGGVICDPLSGWLSDRYGRKPVMLIPGALLLLLILPAFWMLVHYRGSATLYAASAALACITDLSTTTILVVVAESLPRRMRSAGFAILYALSISLFGGSTQFVVAWLVQATGNPLAPAYYMMAAVAAGLCAMLAVSETAPVRALSRTRAAPGSIPAD